MRLTLTIEMDNDAFEDSPYEFRRVLTKVADRAGIANPTGVVLDSNGNPVAKWSIEP